MSIEGTFKYEPINSNKINEVLTQYKGQPVLDYIIELWKLIDYQKDFINKQEKRLIAYKHYEAWKHYDKPVENYDPKTRKYIDRTN